MQKRKRDNIIERKNRKTVTGFFVNRDFAIALTFLFSISFIILFFFGDGIFFYQLNRSLFVFSSEYLKAFIVRPGGLLSFCASFLTQAYISPFSGSLLTSFLLVIMSLVLKSIIDRISEKSAFKLFLALLPSLLVLYAYSYPDINIQNPAGFVLALLWFKGMAFSGNRYIRRIFLYLWPLFYLFAGAFAIISAGTWFTYILIYRKGNEKLTDIIIASIIVAFTYLLSANVLYLQQFKILTGNPLIFNESLRTTQIIVSVALLYIVYPLLIRLTGSSESDKIRLIIQASTLVVVLMFSIYILMHYVRSETSKTLQIEKMFYEGEWDKIISRHEKCASGNIVEQFFYNLALSEKGELCDRMFFGDQSYGPMALSLEGNKEQAFRTMHYYYTIGLVNEAHHLAFEQMVRHGYTPENIKMLIRTDLINGNYKVAERYIDVLDKTILYKKWARRYRNMLVDKQLIATDPDLGEKIRLMPHKDFFIHSDDSRNIDLLLMSNPGNKKAFEYKMARLLLEKDLMAAADESGKLRETGYGRIPRHIQEAALIYSNYSGKLPETGGLNLEPETGRRFLDYLTYIETLKKNRSFPEKKTQKTEKNTFWYYLQFVTIRSDYIKKMPEDRNIY